MSTLIKSNGISSLKSLMEDFWNNENLFDNTFFRKGTLPAVNIKKNEKSFEIEVAAPGYQKKDFKIDVQNRILNISAETSGEKSEEKDNYTRKEFSYSSFNRSFNLPENVKEENVQAKYENGLLQLVVEESEKQPSNKKTITVK